ncbi:hypothetical protein [Streptomyces sp. NPDC057682]|uniref:hypothetical protein n=1 Tax=Streptomyces sp. NPDC057682 TaxID=3346210 RepID=UPI0036A776E5
MTSLRSARGARPVAAAVLASGLLAGAALLTAAPQAAAADGTSASGPSATPAALAAAHEAATDSATLNTLSRFFAREGAVSRAAAAPRVEGATVPVRSLNAAFVAGEPGAPVAALDYLASTAVSSDGQKASLWTLPAPDGNGDWQVVNIASGDDESRYAAAGARALPGGTVFREPQIDAWYVQKGSRVLPLDEDAVKAVGAHGTTLAAYRTRVRAAYADKLPGSRYARSGKAGGYGPSAVSPGPRSGPAVAASAPGSGTPDGGVPATATAAGAAGLLALGGAAVLRLRHRRRTG